MATKKEKPLAEKFAEAKGRVETLKKRPSNDQLLELAIRNRTGGAGRARRIASSRSWSLDGRFFSVSTLPFASANFSASGFSFFVAIAPLPLPMGSLPRGQVSNRVLLTIAARLSPISGET